jgi:hypothetical protein
LEVFIKFCSAKEWCLHDEYFSVIPEEIEFRTKTFEIKTYKNKFLPISEERFDNSI